jgi:ribosomal protein L37AE/L43A
MNLNEYIEKKLHLCDIGTNKGKPHHWILVQDTWTCQKCGEERKGNNFGAMVEQSLTGFKKYAKELEARHITDRELNRMEFGKRSGRYKNRQQRGKQETEDKVA